MPGAMPDQVPAVEGLAPVAGGHLWYWGTRGQGETIVLCHPASQSARIWLYQQPAFAAAGYRVVAYSRRGHQGSSPHSSESSVTQVGDLSGLLDFLAIDSAHVLGAAAGGITATGFAAAHPERVRSLVLAGTIVAPDEEEWRVLYARLGIARVRGAVSTEFLELGPSYRAENPDGVARFAELEGSSKTAGSAPQPLGATVNWTTLAHLTMPVLMLTGEADLYAPPPLQRLVAAHLPNVQTATLREVGHAPYWEAPSQFNGIVLEFLASRRAHPPA